MRHAPDSPSPVVCRPMESAPRLRGDRLRGNDGKYAGAWCVRCSGTRGGLDWPAFPGHFALAWGLPLVGAYYRLQDILR